MENERMGFWDWFIAGFAFTLGASAAGMILGLLGLWLFVKGLSVALPTADRASPVSLPKISQPIERQPRTRTIDVPIPPQSREECLELTGGVANEIYDACRQGRLVEKKTITK
ncbi:hypothetical protein [Algiphilus sp.]|uniref:hypothetical protein n=1 Tax=Algiphilus sp. TaxID=1872431 RepID=UPI0025B90816|nr:hypothetical protein [Algiphilus sp.]MCK5770841.1 hypothetical protein [Algiphilus sp.]